MNRDESKLCYFFILEAIKLLQKWTNPMIDDCRGTAMDVMCHGRQQVAASANLCCSSERAVIPEAVNCMCCIV